MAQRSNGLDVYQRLLVQRRDDAGRALADQRGRLQQEQERLDSLQGFRADYLDGLRGKPGQALDVASLRRYQTYLDNVDRAISQQANRIQAQERALGQRQQGLSDARRNELSVNTVIASRVQDARQRLDKIQQDDLDELASQAYGRRLQSGQNQQS